MNTQSEEEKDKFIALSKSLYNTFPKTQTQHLSISSDFKGFESKLSLFIQERCSQFPAFAFWMSYLNMADLFLNFVCVKRIGNWTLHFQSAAEMVPWYFAYDHLNYARYLLVYIYEMLAVPDTHPSVEEHLAARDSVVQQENQYSFSQTSMDQTIEQTMNKDCKTRDGQLDSLIMLMLFIIGFYHSTNMRKFLEAVLKCKKSRGLP